MHCVTPGHRWVISPNDEQIVTKTMQCMSLCHLIDRFTRQGENVSTVTTGKLISKCNCEQQWTRERDWDSTEWFCLERKRGQRKKCVRSVKGWKKALDVSHVYSHVAIAKVTRAHGSPVSWLDSLYFLSLSRSDETSPSHKHTRNMTSKCDFSSPKYSTIEPCIIGARKYLTKFTREEAERALEGKEDGTFVVRPCSLSPEDYALSFTYRNHVEHVRILRVEDKYGLAPPYRFNSLQELVEYYRKKSLSRHNRRLEVTLKSPLNSKKSPVKPMLKLLGSLKWS